MKDFSAAQKDFDIIEKALTYVWNPKLDFIFKVKSRIENTKVISYDSHKIYVWEKSKEDNTYSKTEYKHKEEITEKHCQGWSAKLRIQKFYNYLPKEWLNLSASQNPIISGGLYTKFIEVQKKLDKPLNPYVTGESYLSTIVHEFGHIYYNSTLPWYFADKESNLKYIKEALDLYKNPNFSTKKISDIWLPNYRGTSEIFAFCTDYSAAKIFWPNHKEDIDKANREFLPNLLEMENEVDPTKEFTHFDNPHNLARVMGKLLVEKYPDTWMDILLKRRYYN